jgi:hypothetical protein
VTDQPDLLTPDYKQGWREGAAALFRALIAEDSGGFIPAERGIKDKNGNAEDWIAVGWIFDSFSRVKDAPKALTLLKEPCDHKGIGLPGCSVCALQIGGRR